MDVFHLPQSSVVDRFVPKNSFDSFLNTKQKKLFSDKLSRITWTHKLALETVHLDGRDVKEIQIFEIELKEKRDIEEILVLIQKVIPYIVIFIVRYDKEYYLSTSVKHANVKNEDFAVIDYTFSSNWLSNADIPFAITLKNNLDWVFNDFCNQFKSVETTTDSIEELVEEQKQNDKLKKEIVKLKSQIAKCKQFNKKVELNMKLKKLEGRLGEG